MRAQRDVVLVTGSAGVFGATVTARLSQCFPVVGLDRRGQYPCPTADQIYVDVASPASIAQALADVRERYGPRVAAVVHLAEYDNLHVDPGARFDQSTVKHTIRLLRGLRDMEVGRFIFASTMLVHRPGEPGQGITEDAPVLLTANDPWMRYELEKVLGRLSERMPVANLRLAHLYDDTCRSVLLARLIERVHGRGTAAVMLPAQSTAGHPFLHVDDLAAVLLALISRSDDLPSSLTLLLGELETLTFNEIHTLLAGLIHGEQVTALPVPRLLTRAGLRLRNALRISADPFSDRWLFDVTSGYYALDTGLARTTLGWQPRRALRACLPEMVAALKRDPAAWYRTNLLGMPDPPPPSPTVPRRPLSRSEQRHWPAGSVHVSD